ncbi:NUDIX hydrolase [Phyllobacterium phragmitis]|uniref:NUDIX hydrolase n=1 Tax=Phyllobacterium phragmitis TaxID=2670329 RepID=A0A2S9IJ16_9HYPH|nr:NUDIX hydrolase [Phyllobacterium phragmitis]PRD40509.1 NUDIX hydrolase [Phyllobacterium phragmitis]
MKHRIAAGALVVRNNRLLLLRHQNGIYDFWAPPGGGVEDNEELAAAAERETFEEAGIRVRSGCLAYIDELIDDSGRMVKFWFLADYVSGEVNVTLNPVANEAITEAGWFSRNKLPSGHVFPALIRGGFWDDLARGFSAPIKLPLQHSIF